MVIRRIALGLFAAACVASSGCQAPMSGGSVRDYVAGLFGRKSPEMAVTTGSAQPVVTQTKVYLKPGTEVQWQVQPAQEQPGQVKNGRSIIGPDGTAVVGPYGECKLAGLTLDQATQAMETHLAAYMTNPSVRLSATISSSPSDLSWRSARAETAAEPVVRSAVFQRQ